MGDGPPGFRRGFTCPAVLRIHSGLSSVSTTGLLPCLADLSRSLRLRRSSRDECPTTPRGKPLGLGCFRFARHYSGNRICFLFLRVLRCFSSPGLPSISYVFRYGSCPFRARGSPIRKSPDQRVLTAPRSISVFVPSFIGS